MAILAGGLVFLAGRKRQDGHAGKTTLWGKVGAIDVAIVIVLAISIAILCKGRMQADRQQANTLLTSADLSKVKLEPLEVWGYYPTYLKCHVYNGTDKTLNDLQVYLYVNDESGGLSHIGDDGKRYMRADEFFDNSPQIKLTIAESELAASALSSRVYKQDFGLIGTVQPHSWSQVNIGLSNCPAIDDGAHWSVLLKAAKHQKGDG